MQTALRMASSTTGSRLPDLNGNATVRRGRTLFGFERQIGYWSQGDLISRANGSTPSPAPTVFIAIPSQMSKPGFAIRLSDWDVDNDGDGTPDSIWVDLGFTGSRATTAALQAPVRRPVRRHGWQAERQCARRVPAHLDPLRYGTSTMLGPVSQCTTRRGGLLTVIRCVFSQFSGWRRLRPRGDQPVAADHSRRRSLAEYQQLMQGAYVSAATPPYYLDGRYGEVNDPNIATPDGNNGYLSNYLISGPMPGRTEQFDPYYLGLSTPVVQVNDLINQMMQSPLRPYLINYSPQQNSPYVPPGYFFDFITSQYALTGRAHTPTGYGTAHNIHGRGGVCSISAGSLLCRHDQSALDASHGESSGGGMNATVNDTVDDPYEFDPSLNAKSDGLLVGANLTTTIDARYTPEEVEAVLRKSDGERLASFAVVQLAPATATPHKRHAVTGDSWDLPAPGVTATDSQQLTDLYLNSASPVYLQNFFKPSSARQSAG